MIKLCNFILKEMNERSGAGEQQDVAFAAP